MQDNNKNYGKRPLWQWILIYLVVGAIIYGIIYYFFLANKSGYIGSSNPSTSKPQASGQNMKSVVAIDYSQSGFAPKTITIKAGTAVTWVNKDSDAVWIASNPHPTHTDLPELNSGQGIPSGGTYSFTFTKKGTWGYHNHLEPSNTGTVIVE